MVQIAQQAGVSLSTVSRVLNKSVRVAPAKRTAVLSAVQTLGYRPYVIAQELASGHSRAIGVLCEEISNPFQSRLLRGVELGLRGSGYYPLFASGEQPAEQAQALDMLLTHRAEALILIGSGIPDADVVAIANRVPTLAVARVVSGLEHRSARVQNREGAYKATRHLLELGHERIAHITGRPQHADALARREGYEQALADAGIARDPALVREGDFEEESGLRAAEALVQSRKRFTAIFAGNDQMAFGAGLALLRRGLRIPDDVSIVGFDDQPSAAYTWPPLTTVRQPAVEMGIAAAASLVNELSGRFFALPSFEAHLVLRESTGRATARAAAPAAGLMPRRSSRASSS
jgi:LacI family transcriptional regulator